MSGVEDGCLDCDALKDVLYLHWWASDCCNGYKPAQRVETGLFALLEVAVPTNPGRVEGQQRVL